MVCYCADCRAAEIALGQPDPSPDGVAIFQTSPDTITLTGGQTLLGLMPLGPKGLLRWHATCCNAPMFNTLSRPTLPFCGVIVKRLTAPDIIGPVRVLSFVPSPGGGARKHQGATLMVWRFVTRMGAARLSGRWRKTPFFNVETGEPVVAPRVLTKEQRAAATR
ncbi:DUF6151 family protein [Arenibacterium sp. CAU 1754]